MRVKITGAVTRESLAQALEAARVQYEAVASNGYRIVVGNLYLTAVDDDGKVVDAVDANDKPVVLTIGVPAEAKQQERFRHADRHELQSSSLPVSPENMEFREASNALVAVYQYRKGVYYIADAITAYLMVTREDAFIESLNYIIETVWLEYEPRVRQGLKKGQIIPRPSFSSNGELLFLNSPSWKSPKKITNPIGCFCSRDIFIPAWSNPHWHEVTGRIEDYYGAVLLNLPDDVAELLEADLVEMLSP